MDKKSTPITATRRPKRRVLRCSIDPGKELNRKQIAVLEEHKRLGLRPHPGMAMIAAGAQYLEMWDDSQFGPNGRWAMRLHKTPAGTYFWLTIGSLSGAYLRQDGSHRGFYGQFMAPIYCVGCGRADLREDALCTKQHRVPKRLLRTLTIRDPKRHKAELRAAADRKLIPPRAAESIHAAVVRNGGWFGTVTLNEAPAPKPFRKGPGPIEKIVGAILTFVWNRVKFLAILTLLGIAAGG